MTAGLLATNKQFYQETYCIYWSINNFHLPRGDYRHSQAFFENISPKHIALIDAINIDLSLADLTPQLLQYLERNLYDDRGGRLRPDDSTREWSSSTSELLRQTWEEKFSWMQRHFSHAKILITCFEDPKWDFLYPGSGLEEEIAGFRTKRPGTTIRYILKWSRLVARDRVRERVQQIGWDNFKEELAAGGWGRRNHDKWCDEPSEIRY